MTKRECVIRALRHEETPEVPVHTDLTEQEAARLAADPFGRRLLERMENGSYLKYFQYWGYPEEGDVPLHFTDDFGITWNRSGADRDIGVIDVPSIAEPDIALYREPYFNEKRFREQCEQTLRDKGDKFCFAGIGFSCFERLWSYVGMENALVYMLTDADFVDGLLDRICDFNCRVIEVANEYPFDGFYFGDDWGQQKGLIMGPDLWRKFIGPRMKRMYGCAKKNGKFILQHSCGDISELFGDLIDMGLDCYQTFQPEIYDMGKIKAKYGKNLSFWGGISTQRLLPFASEEEIRETTRRTIRLMRQGGGYIAAPTHAVPADVPAKSLAAMWDAFEEN